MSRSETRPNRNSKSKAHAAVGGIQEASERGQYSLLRMRAMRVTSLMVLGMIVLLQYQNCAPAGGSSASSADASTPVSIIDQNNQGFDVSFVQKHVTIQSSAQTVSLDGACSLEQDGAVFQWQLKSADASVLGTGSASCQAGKFVVAIAPTQSLDCDQPYQVSAQIGTGQAGEVLLTRKCEATSTGAVSTNQKSLASDSLQRSIETQSIAGSKCVVETRTDSGSGCSIACYDVSGVELKREALPTSACDL